MGISLGELEGNLANSINVYAAGCRTEDSGCELDGKILKAAIMFPVYALTVDRLLDHSKKGAHG